MVILALTLGLTLPCRKLTQSSGVWTGWMMKDCSVRLKVKVLSRQLRPSLIKNLISRNSLSS